MQNIAPKNRLGIAALGWMAISVAATQIIVFDEHRSLTHPNLTKLILLAVPVWGIFTICGAVIYFSNAWKSVPQRDNRKVYVAWLGFESAIALSVLAFILWVVSQIR